MELDQLKQGWKKMDGESKSPVIMLQMIKENRHPVLKGIRLQMMIEMAAWVIFLFVYYDMFDGDQKPVYANVLLVAAVILLLVHSMMGYFSGKYLVKGNDLKQSLLRYFSTLKIYAWVSVISRVGTIICLLLFFTSTIEFTTTRYLLLAGLLLIFPVQVYLLARVWKKRINKINFLLKAFQS